MATETDALGHVTSYAYDGLNRVTTRTEAVGSAVQRSMTMIYDKAGNATRVSFTGKVTVTYTNLTNGSTYSPNSSGPRISRASTTANRR